MNPADRSKFSSILYGLASTFGAKVSDEALRLQFETLKPYSLEQIEKAAVHILRTRVYTGSMPTPGEFVQTIEGTIDDRAQSEAARVAKAIRDHGAWASVNFRDPVTHAVIVQRFGGWIKLCETLQESELGFFHRDFLKAYASYSNMGIEHNRHLPGCTV